MSGELEPAEGSDVPGAFEVLDGVEVPGVTPARVLLGRAGTSYRTSTHLRLRADHAAARDALHERIALDDEVMAPLVERVGLFEVRSGASSPAEHLARPDLGRRLADGEAEHLRAECPTGVDVQVVVGDGLSARAVHAQVPVLLPGLLDGAAARGWSVGRPFFVRHCRVGLLNDIGAALDPEVVVLLVGERPGLAIAESLSAYLAFRPRPGHTDADRNLVSNIHADGVAPDEAARRVLDLAAELLLRQRSGYQVKELGGA
ncbi:ethanolamine ammonia-lyase subunit EutC [Rhabdothermincola salaria]|uniref:ethanolamine ammonia-lyase subunit EutC n=1 Tax=Rhabdothermincola salaria TaxID=2903142 RepID=UPI001E569809|nr:ethanolamine ammonia-lyase subunit EutC [Rhabdothermincola salaria]